MAATHKQGSQAAPPIAKAPAQGPVWRCPAAFGLDSGLLCFLAATHARDKKPVYFHPAQNQAAGAGPSPARPDG